MSEAVANGYSPLERTDLAQLRRRAILSCAIGNFFELFDFTIYGYFAVAITRAFYPSGSMYGTYAAFGAAFLMRPVGAVIIGAYGDRMGRRAALVVTIWLMAGATGAVGLIPSYSSIGYLAPVLLVICRLLQGFSTGGEWGGAAAFLIEYAPPGKRGLTGSWQQFSTQIGGLTGSLSAALLAASLSEAVSMPGAGAFRFFAASCLGRSAIICAGKSRKRQLSSMRWKHALSNGRRFGWRCTNTAAACYRLSA